MCVCVCVCEWEGGDDDVKQFSDDVYRRRGGGSFCVSITSLFNNVNSNKINNDTVGDVYTICLTSLTRSSK